MTDLQVSLMAIGGVVVVGVISYNKWQEYKAKKSVQRAFASEHDDVLMTPPGSAGGARAEGAERQEPSLTPDQFPEIDAPGDTDGMRDDFDLAVESPMAQAAAQMPVRPAQKELLVDELIDCLITLAPAAPVRGEKILPKIQGLRHVGNKPVHVIGQREDGLWEDVAHGGVYYVLRAGSPTRSMPSRTCRT
jgi:hypothetical protein